MLAAVIRSLAQKGWIDLDQCFIEAAFAPATGGGEGGRLTRKGKGTKSQLIVDGHGLPLGASVVAANVAEWHMAPQTLDLFAHTAPERLIGDKAYDGDELDETLAAPGLEMIAPIEKPAPGKTRLKTAGPCALTDIAGSWTAPSPGSERTAACSCAGKRS